MAAPQRPFSSDQHRIGQDREGGDAEKLQVGLPCRPIGEQLVVMLGEQPDDRSGKRAAAHIGERFGVDHVVAMPGAQQLQEIEPALRGGRAEPGEVVVADLGTVAVHRLVARAGVIDRDPGRRLQPGAQHAPH